jgi:hypothetical protein
MRPVGLVPGGTRRGPAAVMKAAPAIAFPAEQVGLSPGEALRIVHSVTGASWLSSPLGEYAIRIGHREQ